MVAPLNNNHSLSVDFQMHSQTFCTAVVTVPKPYINALYDQTVRFLQRTAQAPGFHKGDLPFDYVKQTFHPAIVDHIKEFLFNYSVVGFLYDEIYDHKLIIAGEPRLKNIVIDYNQNGTFTFEVTLSPTLSLPEWKHFPFKAPRRKNYKDLDRQVESFIKEEKEQYKGARSCNSIDIGDWVCCDIVIVDKEHKPLFDTLCHKAWFKVGNEEVDSPLQEVFLGKQSGDCFFSSNKALQEYFGEGLATDYTFSITINDILKNSFFCFDQFKKHFRLKTNKEVTQKLIEVFSYRNDLSQRRSTVEETFKLLMSKHRFEAPHFLILRQQESLLERIQTNPDYHVYRMQKDFQKRVEELAEKQAKECLLLDHVSYQENIIVTDEDIKSYLNLTQRPRTKEFIYFDPPESKVRGQEFPIAYHELKRICSREKTLNHIIYYLTRK